MTQQVVYIGAAANDGTGDPLRSAMAKINANFTEVYAAVVSTTDTVARAAAAAAQSTANTAVTNAAAAQSTATTAASTATAAQSAATAAQSTANTAVTNAASAQTTANTGVANAAAAQATANTGVTNAAAAQTTANLAQSQATSSAFTIAYSGLASIQSGTTVDAGKVLTNDSSTAGLGVYRKLSSSDLSNSANVVLDVNTIALQNKRIIPRANRFTYTASVTLSDTAFDIFICDSLTGNITFAMNTTSGFDGERKILRVKQDATGNRTVSFSGSNIVTTTSVGLTANTSTQWEFVYDSVRGQWLEISARTGL